MRHNTIFPCEIKIIILATVVSLLAGCATMRYAGAPEPTSNLKACKRILCNIRWVRLYDSLLLLPVKTVIGILTPASLELSCWEGGKS